MDLYSGITGGISDYGRIALMFQVELEVGLHQP